MSPEFKRKWIAEMQALKQEEEGELDKRKRRVVAHRITDDIKQAVLDIYKCSNPSLMDVAERLQISHSSVRKILSDAGVKRRRAIYSGRSLTPDQVRECRALYERDLFTVSELAAKYGVTSGTIDKLLNWHTYKDVV